MFFAKKTCFLQFFLYLLDSTCFCSRCFSKLSFSECCFKTVSVEESFMYFFIFLLDIPFFIWSFKTIPASEPFSGRVSFLIDFWSLFYQEFSEYLATNSFSLIRSLSDNFGSFSTSLKHSPRILSRFNDFLW